MAKQTVTVRERTDGEFDVVVDDSDHDGVVIGSYPTKQQAEQTAVSALGESHDLAFDVHETEVENPILTDEMKARPASPLEGGPAPEPTPQAKAAQAASELAANTGAPVVVTGETLTEGATPAAKAATTRKATAAKRTATKSRKASSKTSKS